MADFANRYPMQDATNGGNPFGSQVIDLTRLVGAAQATTQAVNNLNQTINSKFPDWVAVPATAGATGTAGQVAYDATHFYVCVATNTWVRVGLATF